MSRNGHDNKNGKRLPIFWQNMQILVKALSKLPNSFKALKVIMVSILATEELQQKPSWHPIHKAATGYLPQVSNWTANNFLDAAHANMEPKNPNFTPREERMIF